MKKIRTTFINTYKRNSIFTKIFLVLLTMSLLMLGMVYYYFKNLTADNFREKTFTSTINMLSTTSNSVDLMLSSIGQSMNELLWNSDVVSVVISPKLSTYTQKTSVARNLGMLVKNNNFIFKAYLYVHKENVVYTSAGGIENFDSFADKAVFCQYLSGRNSLSQINGNGFATKIYIDGNRIMLLQEFPTPEKNATLIVELNSTAVYTLVAKQDKISAKEIYIFSSMGKPVFAGQVPYPAQLGLLADQNFDLLRDKFLSTPDKIASYIGQDGYFNYQSPVSGWIFMYPFDRDFFDMDISRAVSMFFPFLVVFFLISLAFSLYVTYSIYRPINDLLYSVVGLQPNGDELKKQEAVENEFDFLKVAYENVLDRTSRLTTLMATISPVLREKLYKNLLFGKELSEEYLEEYLRFSGSPFASDNHFVVLATNFNQPSVKRSSDMEVNLFNISLGNIISSLSQNRCNYDSLITDDSQLIAILGFDREIQVIEVKRIIITLCREIAVKVDTLPYRVLIGRGKIYHNIADIKYSYSQAKEDLRLKNYEGNENGISSQNMADFADLQTSSNGFDVDYFQERYNNMLQAVLEGSCSQGFNLLERTVNEIVSCSDGGGATAQRLLEMLVDTLIEKMISMRINGEEAIFAEAKYVNRDFNTFSDLSEMQNFTLVFGRQALELIASYNRKSRYKYIELAKEYVAANYSNSSLSLNLVSDYIGINHMYLSRLFYENSNQHFVDYLNQYRVDKAKQMLDITKLTSKEIGFKTGFNSTQNFNRVFKKYVGLTPGQYRDRNRQ